MDARQRAEDAYKRKLQRIKVRSVENPFQFGTAGKNTKWKFHPLKLIVAATVLGALLTILSSPTACTQNGRAISGWIWGSADPRYISELDIHWEDAITSLKQIPKDIRIKGVSLLNFNEHEVRKWKNILPNANHTVVHQDPANKNLTWEALFPEWIDEEEDDEVPNCPSLPSIEVPRQRSDLIAVKLPCRRDGNWSRDVARLHLQISAARLATSCKSDKPVNVLFMTRCFPLPNMFTGKDLVSRKGDTWLYEPNMNALRGKLRLPIGSCELALPLGGIEQEYPRKRQREAYATVLHSTGTYVCGAIVAARSIRRAGSTKDLLILVDETISNYYRRGLELAGWKVRIIQRIRNPKAEKDAYNEWNYSKFRLWQLTDYDKIIFIDSDLLILKNIDFLFGMPEISATGNSGPLFNSGVMVIEPSNSTFQLLMDHINDIESYNGGNQGYLNEIFTWWHRIPRHVNFLKHIWVGDDELVKRKKTRLFEAEPPILYVLHYLGNKPWACFRDYDCNWNVDRLREFASDFAHRRWWKVHDSMPERLQEFCLLPTVQKAQLEFDRREAEKGNYSDGHWRIEIRDERLQRCRVNDKNCNWRGMLNHWEIK